MPLGERCHSVYKENLRCFENAGNLYKIKSTFLEVCSDNVALQETICLYGGLISTLLATCIICSVFMSVLFK